MPYQIWNRRYTGSKYKLASWIADLISTNCVGKSFCDLFAGTAVVSTAVIEKFDEIYINDFLYSNEIIYRAFFEQEPYNLSILEEYKDTFSKVDVNDLLDNYVSLNFGGKFFSENDAKKIGFIRETIEKVNVNKKERNILLASLIYSLDKSANTVGHYDAYIKGKPVADKFVFDLISPYTYDNKLIHIFREDANKLAENLLCDVVYIDPPYNSRQYSRFYHILENIACWKKPALFGEALKPEAENMSEYCRSSATKAFGELISSLNCKYIVVSYNNTYNSKSSSSKNKITLEDIESILSARGTVKCFEKPHPYFNAGKTNLENHKELIYIVKVGE